MKYIPLTQGKQAIIDDEDYTKVMCYKWNYSRLNSTEYARAGKWRNGHMVTIRMHRLIMNAPQRYEVDHINGDGLDNRRQNLRLCYHHQNVKNTPKRKDTTNKYKGIHFLKNRIKWIARLQIDNYRINSGYFNTPEEAAKRYDELAKKHFGEYARLNFAP